MYETCKFCKYWKKRYRGEGERFHVCIRTDWAYLFSDNNVPVGNDAVMFVDIYGKNYLDVELRTGADFGCSQFEKYE